MIWMGVGGPGDWNALVNRFPPHYQWVVTTLNGRFVARSNGVICYYPVRCSLEYCYNSGVPPLFIGHPPHLTGSVPVRGIGS